MSANCKITDIYQFSPINSTTLYFLDTNVLYWYTNPRVSATKLTKQAQVYYDFVDHLTSAGNPLITSVYNLTELLNVIEKNEFSLYKELHPDEDYLTKKDFRRMSSERQKLQRIMQTTLNNVRNICKIVDFSFEQSKITEFVNSLTDHRCDIFDYMILDNCVKEQTLNIISDDSDFSTFDNIKLFTANTSVIPST